MFVGGGPVRCLVCWAGLVRAGLGGAACRLLAALRGRRSVQIVTSAGKYVVTKFPGNNVSNEDSGTQAPVTYNQQYQHPLQSMLYFRI